MQIQAVTKIIGILLMIFSVTMLVPIPVSFCFHDYDVYPFLVSFGYTFLSGLFLYGLCFRHVIELKIRDGFLIVTLFWTVLSAFSALPLWFGGHDVLSFTDAMFECVSGFTTTGSTVISDLNVLSPALLYYRQQLQFLGGMGIIVLAVAILPMLGVGGMQLYRAETPGPMKDDKMTPRVTETAKAIWMVYLGLVIACILCYWLAGMPLFNAVEEGFATISTGGFSPHNGSFAYYHSHLIELVAIFFMFLGGINFSLHYIAATRLKPWQYWKDHEFRDYLFILVGACLVVGSILWMYRTYGQVTTDWIESTFAVVSIMTTTGFVSGDFANWPTFIPFLIVLLGLLGGCGGSTSGGMKIIRVSLLKAQFLREMRRLIHPQGVYLLKLGNKVVSISVMEATWAFVTAYIGILLLVMILLMATGISLDDAFGAAAASIGNMGAGLGKYAYSFAGLDPFAKWVLIFAMVAGRLEVFTVLVLLSRSFWKK